MNAFGVRWIISKSMFYAIYCYSVLIMLLSVARYSSLDRKSQKNKLKKQLARQGSNQPPTKSTSLGSFNFITRPEEALDAISVTSGNSESKRAKEKQW